MKISVTCKCGATFNGSATAFAGAGTALIAIYQDWYVLHGRCYDATMKVVPSKPENET